MVSDHGSTLSMDRGDLQFSEVPLKRCRVKAALQDRFL